ncbi:hypothetical protein A7985_18680 [Pseudoalteromonas luteoviolacea]|uniref:Helix-hairpin-helix DNA-binding motif class 1 domain-containing protein n=1 Tax=Pseudoalteromonas luteoviolacea TaxID=43657 RepID=A0A1C0TMM4_9GAMM|nr:ComEA family DNA-binding protein [Pseudoalteromonas luteoviolacea]MBQ4812335.1 ComEA family DNA-binding protein [Pseudoalteromonas luteoviolacea]OCQ19927.1 hypothetical protein A7985_18680 [Pseudoalteromonas luteoviolacea]
MLFKNLWSAALFIGALTLCHVVQAQTQSTVPEVNQVMVNINTATVEQLITLPGIGRSKALAIVADREEVGEFSDLEALTRVKGIGKGIVDKLKERVVFQ